MSCPQARKENVSTSAVGSELVVYDRETERAHSLNRTAAEVWLHADGTRSVDDLARHLQEELDPKADRDLVLVTLDGLRRAGLLVETDEEVREAARASRRRFVRKVGTVGALSLLLPMIQSITSPAAAEAASAPGKCQKCEGCETCESCEACEASLPCESCEACEASLPCEASNTCVPQPQPCEASNTCTPTCTNCSPCINPCTAP